MPKIMNLQIALKFAKFNTLAHWWNSESFPKQNNYVGICNELIELARDEAWRDTPNQQYKIDCLNAAQVISEAYL